jgi:hypothetical protein
MLEKPSMAERKHFGVRPPEGEYSLCQPCRCQPRGDNAQAAKRGYRQRLK